ncbi:transcription factor MYB14-like [Capsicum galapagoense]
MDFFVIRGQLVAYFSNVIFGLISMKKGFVDLFDVFDYQEEKSALSLCEEDTHKQRNDPNSLEFCPNKLNSSANQDEGLIAWSFRIDGIECSLPNDYPSISSSSKVHSETFNKIETIQSRSAWLMCNDEKYKSRNGPNSLEFCQANELNSSANQVEGLNNAWSSRIDSIECSLPNDYPSISNSSKVHPETFDKIEKIQSRSVWLLCNADKHKSRNDPNSSKGIQANELNSNHVEGLFPFTSKSSNLNKNCIPKFSELDDIDAWEIPQDDEAISFFFGILFFNDVFSCLQKDVDGCHVCLDI